MDRWSDKCNIKEIPKNYIKDKRNWCPKCDKKENVYHIMPFDYMKYCSKCDVEFMGRN